MVNHIRTLLLNEDPENTDLLSASLAFPIDRSFRKSGLSGWIGSLHVSMMLGTGGMDDRIARVNIVYSAMSRVDLTGVVPIDDSVVTDFKIPDDGFVVSSVFCSPNARRLLFTETGVDAFDDSLRRLKACTAVDGVMDISASIAAYAIRLELERIRHG